MSASRNADASARTTWGSRRGAIGDNEIMGGFMKGLSVVEAFERDRDELTIAEVGKAASLDRATARRCLLTLVKLGYAETDGKRFRLTPRVLRLGYAYLTAAPLPRLVQPYLEHMSEKTGESCSASILDDDEIVYVARASQRRVLSVGLNVGSRLPAYCASMGRVLLAALPRAQAHQILTRSPRKAMTPRTITDLDRLMAVLDEVREKDYAIVDQELEVGLRSIAVPLRDARRNVVAAINFGLHAARMTCERMEHELLPELRAVQASAQTLLR